jgi:hypothetical protein
VPNGTPPRGDRALQAEIAKVMQKPDVQRRCSRTASRRAGPRRRNSAR